MLFMLYNLSRTEFPHRPIGVRRLTLDCCWNFSQHFSHEVNLAMLGSHM